VLLYFPFIHRSGKRVITHDDLIAFSEETGKMILNAAVFPL